MKAKLTFTLPDEEGEFRDAIQGRDAKCVLWAFDTYLRNRLKYDDASLTREAYAALEAARDELLSMLVENRVSLDE